jgi:two-component system, response regulator
MSSDEKYILLIEDNPDDVLLTMRALKQSKIVNNVVVAKDGVEALEFLLGTNREPRGLPQLVLLDLKLPKVDGLEVLKRLRQDERTQLLPIVILTSSREQRDLIGSYRLGANSYIQKPVDFGQFAEAVHQLGLYWLVLNEAPPQ